MNPIICEKGYVTVRLPRAKSDNRKNPRHVALSGMYSGLRNRTMRGLGAYNLRLILVAKANVAFTSLVCNISRYTNNQAET